MSNYELIFKLVLWWVLEGFLINGMAVALLLILLAFKYSKNM